MDRTLLIRPLKRSGSVPARLLLMVAVLIGGSGMSGCDKADPDPGLRPGTAKAGGISGTLVDESGRPVVAARVKAFPAASAGWEAEIPAMDSTSPPESTLTDGEGRYGFDSLPDGEYNLVGTYKEGALTALIPEVSFSASLRGTDLGSDTLTAPGMIRGKVEAAGKGLRDVYCYLPGTSYLAISDDSGYFAISKVPRGRYMLRYTSPGYLTLSDTAVPVASGRVTQVPVRGLNPETSGNPPAPSGLEAVYDTLWARIDLKWRHSQAPNVAGYLVYRDDDSGSVPKLLNDIPLTDTVYSDVLKDLVQEGIPKKVVYRIKTLDRDANASLKFSPSVTLQAVHPLTFAGITSIRIEGSQMGEISLGDTVRLIAGYRNSRGGMKTLHWAHRLPDGLWDSLGTRVISDSAGEDTLIWIGNRTAYHIFTAIAGNASGSFGSKDTGITVLLRPPVVSVGPDTTVSMGDRVNLRGSASDSSGYITRMEWSIDGSAFRTASADTFFLAPNSFGREVVCVFRATDDDGNSAEFSMLVHVKPDPPVARVMSPFEARSGDTVRVSAAGSTDVFGRIVKWEWDIGKTGVFVSGAGPEYAFSVPETPDRDFPCVLRVTDDDGEIDSAEFRIAVRPNGKWIKVQGSAPFKDSTGFYSLGVFDGKVWILGAKTYNSWDPVSVKIWSSTDMVVWEESDVEFPMHFSSIGPGIMVFGDKMILVATKNPDLRMEMLTSRDGRTWIPSPESPPTGFDQPSTAVFQEKLWVTGTLWPDVPYLKAMWSYSAASGWVKSDKDLPFSRRINVQFTTHAGRLWAYGGFWNGGFLRDLWHSPDGVNWTKVTDSVPIIPSHYESLVSLGDRLCMVSIREDAPDSKVTQFACSEDGVSWKFIPESAGFPLNFYGVPIAFKGKLWMIKGAGEPDGGEIWLAPAP